jgi:hypothetical protein
MVGKSYPAAWVLASCVLLLVAAGFPATTAAQDARVELELVMEPGFPTEQARKWIAMLDKAGITGVRIRGGNVGDSVKLEPTGTRERPGYHVTGILTLDEKLILPGGKFTANDAAGIARWLAKLKEGGSEGLDSKPAAFGLTPSQLVATHEGLSGKVSFTTKGQSPRDVVEKIGGTLKLKLTTDAAALDALEACDPVGDELIGLSHGTALAAAIRPAGLVMVPVKGAGQVQLRITSSKSASESWPIGWPLPAEKSPKELVPDLLKFIPVEINDTSLGDALSAIVGRLKVPLVIDYNALARNRVDLATKKVSLPKSKTFYSKILDKLLFQARLKYELRLDEADQPFLWVTSVE